jgi:hypothetical protein
MPLVVCLCSTRDMTPDSALNIALTRVDLPVDCDSKMDIPPNHIGARIYI